MVASIADSPRFKNLGPVLLSGRSVKTRGIEMKTAEPTFVVRVMRAEEVGLLGNWSAAEGWNPRAARRSLLVSVRHRGVFHRGA
jgi:hypothetical protein